jgi:peptidoglycan/LPS O-acetylase OafA/YrhL
MNQEASAANGAATPPDAASACPADPYADTGTSPPVTRKEIKPLTTLRFFAAYAVVVSHASESFSCWHGLSSRYVVGQAVSFFFVLSGFILTYNYFHLKDARGVFNFYIARLARIWPAHVSSLVILLFLIPEVFKVHAGDLPLFFCNLFLLQGWIPIWNVFFSYNASAWSISSEMFFYLCFPLLLWGMKKCWYLPLAVTSLLLGLLICLCNLLHLPESDLRRVSIQGLLYINPLSGIFDFGAGMIAAVLWRDWLSGIKLNKALATILELGALAGVCLLNVYSSGLRYACLPWAGEAAAYWMQNSGPSIAGFALLIMIFAMDKGWLSRLFGTPALVLLGELSFGIYMLHGVFITFLGVNFPQRQSIFDCAVFLVTLFAAAHLMFEIVEKPMRKLMIKKGQSILNHLDRIRNKDKEQSGQTKKASPVKAEHWKRRLLLGLEALALVVFVFFNLPTVHRLSDTEARTLTKAATVKNVVLPPYLKCRDATAAVSGETLSLTLVWESLQAQEINFNVIATVLDSQGRTLALKTYCQDGRHSRLKAGDCWTENLNFSITPGQTPAVIALTIVKNKRLVLRTISSTRADCTFTIPVTR